MYAHPDTCALEDGQVHDAFDARTGCGWFRCPTNSVSESGAVNLMVNLQERKEDHPGKTLELFVLIVTDVNGEDRQS